VVFAVDLHGDFDRSQRPVWNYSNKVHVPDIYAAQTNRRSYAKTLSVKKIGFQDEFGGEETAGTAHENDQDRQNQASDHDRYSNLQFRPFQLLLARQLSSQAEWRRVSLPLMTGTPAGFS
jgi:hypothetical protein